eukprot:CAMPEP_0170480786 /NCGR_PEP_ID=MMETSP0208-20121228/1486_1 /TAXON_ID=197538 /ORGANISM="Strombidium inclinatum, Strain S3" /LENGTH=142 /DNA_ID=CAMNT_0010753383 /DNA_START=347 /DNA_END=772 /DNA_ORIENTATION=-
MDQYAVVDAVMVLAAIEPELGLTFDSQLGVVVAGSESRFFAPVDVALRQAFEPQVGIAEGSCFRDYEGRRCLAVVVVHVHEAGLIVYELAVPLLVGRRETVVLIRVGGSVARREGGVGRIVEQGRDDGRAVPEIMIPPVRHL